MTDAALDFYQKKKFLHSMYDGQAQEGICPIEIHLNKSNKSIE